MADLITEAREMCRNYKRQRHIPETMLAKTLELCDALDSVIAECTCYRMVLDAIARASKCEGSQSLARAALMMWPHPEGPEEGAEQP